MSRALPLKSPPLILVSVAIVIEIYFFSEAFPKLDIELFKTPEMKYFCVEDKICLMSVL